MKSRSKPLKKPFNWFARYLMGHLRDALSSFGELCRKPFSSLMILLVIGISLALPLSFLVLLKNLTQFTDNFKGQSQITLFLKMGSATSMSATSSMAATSSIDSTIATDSMAAMGSIAAMRETAEKLKKALSKNPSIEKINIISPETALPELLNTLNIQDAVQALPNNPLPWVLVLTLAPSFHEGIDNTKKAEQLLEELQRLPEVEKADLDLQWLKRLAAATHLAEHFVTAISLLLSLAILLVIGNTLGLYIENRREDIEIAKLIGATDGFVRRPFLYMGIWYGTLGAVLAISLVVAIMIWLQKAAEPLLASYQSHFVLQGLDPSTSFSLLLLGVLLGFGAAWLSVSRHLTRGSSLVF